MEVPKKQSFVVKIDPASKCSLNNCAEKCTVAFKCKFCPRVFHVDCAMVGECFLFYNSDSSIHAVICFICKNLLGPEYKWTNTSKSTTVESETHNDVLNFSSMEI